MTIPHFNVVICTPGSSMTPSYVRSLLKVTYYMNQNNITWNFMTEYSSHVADARERTLGGSAFNDKTCQKPANGEWTYDKLFWIDSDIEWTPEDFLKLYYSDLDIISGLYQTNPNGTVAVNLTDPLGRPTLVNKVHFLLWDVPVEVGGVGFGFVAMKSGVFEKMNRPWFKIREVQWDNLDFKVNMGEDYSWCEGAKEAGFKIWVDPLVKLKHHKEIIYVVE